MIFLLACLAVLFGTVQTTIAQQLEPRAYSVSPTGVNIAIAGYGYSAGDLNFDPSLPIDSGSGRINVVSAAYFRSMNVLGRSANTTIALPYSWGHLQGNYMGAFTPLYRSGWMDPFARFAINLYGAPAMNLKEFAAWRPKTTIGASLTFSAPLGQYDPVKLINIGTNRWAFKPEIGISRRIGRSRLLLDAYAGAWLYTANTNFQGRRRTQKPIASLQFHASYDIKPRWWIALDANFFRGGRTSIGGIERNDLQSNSRLGATFALPLSKRQSMKFSYAAGAYTTIGGNFRTLTFAYQYLWGGGL